MKFFSASLATETHTFAAAPTGLGITLHDEKLIVVKSTQHFHASFAPLARAVLYVDTPGAVRQDFAHLDFKVRKPNYWPRLSNPLAVSDPTATRP